MKRDISVCIASRGNPLGVWCSIESICQEAEIAGLNFGFAVVTNGEEFLEPDTRQILALLKASGRLDYHRHEKLPMTPQAARDECVKNTDSELIFFADNHILLSPMFFKRAVLDIEKYDCKVLHSSTTYYYNDVTCYHYKIKPYADFWATSETLIENEFKPYKIAAAGHGAFFVNRKTYNDLDFYYLSSGFTQYAGEEISSCFSATMRDVDIWLDPRLLHRHFAAATRNYARHHVESFYKNLFSCAFIITDETADNYVFKMLQHFNKVSKPVLRKPMYDIMIEAKDRSEPFRQWFNQRKLRTFEEQLKLFDARGIPY